MSNQMQAFNPKQAVADVCRTLQRPEYQQMIKAALPSGVTLDRFSRVTLTAIQQNPAILDGVDRQSFYNAVVRAAQDGLYPDGREAAIVKYGAKAQYMPMIGGVRKVLAKHGFALATGVIHQNDSFTYELGVVPVMHHTPAPLGQPRGNPIGAWAQARDASGNVYLEVMGFEDIETVRKASRSANGGPWKEWWGEMARKTVGRRLAKQLPLYEAEDVERVMASDNEHCTVSQPETDDDTVVAEQQPISKPSVRDRMGVTDEQAEQEQAATSSNEQDVF